MGIASEKRAHAVFTHDKNSSFAVVISAKVGDDDEFASNPCVQVKEHTQQLLHEHA
jgi:hypothetical protein